MLVRHLVIPIIIWGCLFITLSYISAEMNEDIDLSTVELIRKYGYPVEVYSNITTEDNYLLDVYRIPHGKLVTNKTASTPILLMHGFLSTSRDFVILGPKRALAYLLADQGYDVWLPNSRGSVYSRKHSIFNPDKDKEYWQFSWHEIGEYDLPAIFDLMRNITKKERFSYIGMSQGAIVYYILASMKPEYNQNVTIMISFGPPAYMSSPLALVRVMAALEPFWAPISEMLSIHEFPPRPIASLVEVANKVFCTRQETIFQEMCSLFFYVTGGYDPVQLSKEVVPVYLGVGPSGPLRQLRHFAQIINFGLFREFNYGEKGNLQKYGIPDPPSYNLSEVTTPIALMYSEGDGFVNPRDIRRLCSELSNCVYKYKVPFRQFNHYDFLIATDVVELVYEKVFDILRKYNKMNI